MYQAVFSSPAKNGLGTRLIASLCIHIERVIDCIKTYAILRGTMPNNVMRVANQIIAVCAWLTNFQPILIPPPAEVCSDNDVDSYFLDEESDYDADSKLSDSNDED